MSFLIPDLVSIVISNLDQADLYECMKVSRRMYSDVLPVYYRKVIVKGKHHKRFLEFIKAARKDGRKIGDYVREITFEETRTYCIRSHYNLSEDEFSYLMQNIPFVRKIVLYDYNIYAMHLQRTSLTQLSHVQEIKYHASYIGLDWDTYWGCFLANVRFKDRIVTLHCQFQGRIRIESCLPGFVSLKHLYVKDNRDTGLIQILNACSNRLFTLECMAVGSPDISPPYPIFTNLTSLTINVLCITVEHTKWITRHLPNLSTFKLKFKQQNVVSFLASLSEDCACDFYRFLSRINYVNIGAYSIDPLRVIRDMSLRRKIIFDFMHGLNDCNKSVFKFNLKSKTTYPRIRQEFFIFEKRGNLLEINTDWLVDIFADEMWTSQIDFVTLNGLVMLNSLPQAMRNGRQLQWKTVNSQLIKPAITLLQQLQPTARHLVIRNYYQRLAFLDKKVNFYHEIVSDLDLLYMFNVHSSSSSTRYGYLKHLLLTTDLLHSLGQLYPAIKELTFDRCTIDQAERSKQYTLDLSCFDNIHQLTLDTDMILSVRKSRQLLYFVIVTPSQKSQYCFNERKENVLLYIQNQQESDIPKSAYVIKILCKNTIQKFAFRRRKKHVPIRTYQT